MKALKIIATILNESLDNSFCGVCNFKNFEDIESWFGHVTCGWGIQYDTDYVYYWPCEDTGNVFEKADAGFTLVIDEADGEFENVYLMKIE